MSPSEDKKTDEQQKPEAPAERLASAWQKSASFFKKAKAAVVDGDEAAQDELSDALAKAQLRLGEAVERTGAALEDIRNRIDEKLEENWAKRDAPKKPPQP